MKQVFLAKYNPMTEESGFITLSVHASFDGAAEALAKHKEGQRTEWMRMYPTDDEEPYPFGTFEMWSVEQVEVLP